MVITLKHIGRLLMVAAIASLWAGCGRQDYVAVKGLEAPPRTNGGAAEARLMLDSCSTIGHEFSPELLVRGANALIQLGSDQAYTNLWIRAQEQYPDYRKNQEKEGKIMLLCILLYGTSSKQLRLPHIGAPDVPYHSMKPKDWPHMPLVFSDGVPFLMTSSYTILGLPAETSLSYLECCRTNGEFRTTALPIPTRVDADKALKDLFNSRRWKRIKWEDSGKGWSLYMDERGHKEWMMRQVERIPAK